jgi:ribose-phosphate pyrophosphokinase
MACVLHPVLSGEASRGVQASCLTELIVTDSVWVPPERRCPKATFLSIAGLLGDAIRRIHEQTSVSELLRW